MKKEAKQKQPIKISPIEMSVLCNLTNKFENKEDYDKLLKIINSRQDDEEYDNLIIALSEVENVSEFRNFADLSKILLEHSHFYKWWDE